MPDGKEAFWIRWLNYWVDEYAKENPKMALGTLDDMKARFKEDKPWNDYDHVTDFLMDQKAYPDFARWVSGQQTSERVQRLEEAERLQKERTESDKKRLRELLLDYEIEKEDVARLKDQLVTGAPGIQEQFTKINLDIKGKVDSLIKSIALIKSLSDEGYEPAENFLKDHMRDVIVQEVGEELKDATKYEIEEMRKRLKLELDRVRKAVDRIESTVTKDEMREFMAGLMTAIGQIPGVPPVAAPEIPEARIPRPQALEEARKLFDKNDRAGATRKLLQGGFTGLQIEGLYEDWARFPARAVGGVSADEMRKVMREEISHMAQAAAGPPEDYEVEWLQSADYPDCWDQYTLGLGMKSLAIQKLALAHGIPYEEVESQLKDKRITQDEYNDFMYGNEEKGIPGISTEEVCEKLIKTNSVQIIPRNREFESRLMQLPFPWGDGVFFKLSPEGRRHSHSAIWNRLDTLCKVVVEMMESGIWSYRSLREAGVPSSFVRKCRREVKGEG